MRALWLTIDGILRNLFSSLKSSRWRNSIVHGVQDGDRELPGEHDYPFYGAEDLSDSSDEEEHATTPAKRLDDGDEDEHPSNSN